MKAEVQVCVLTQWQRGRTSAMILEKQLLPINLVRVRKPFPNYLDSITLRSEQLLTSGKHSKWLLIFPGADILARSPWCQAVQCCVSETANKPRATSQALSLAYPSAWWGRSDDWGLFCSYRTWTPCNHWANHKLPNISMHHRQETENQKQPNKRTQFNDRSGLLLFFTEFYGDFSLPVWSVKS